MLAAIDIHKAVFQAAVLDPANGELTEERFKASREALGAWIERHGELEAVAIEATTAGAGSRGPFRRAGSTCA